MSAKRAFGSVFSMGFILTSAALLYGGDDAKKKDHVHPEAKASKAQPALDRIKQLSGDWVYADGDKKVQCPLLILWGQRGTVGRLYDPMAIWRQHAGNVVGKPLPAGHFLPEELPDETLAELLPFLVG